jgi:uncharacterized protein
MKIIDCHANVGWDVNNTRKNLYPVSQTYVKLHEKMDNANIEQSVIIPFPSPGAQFQSVGFWYDIENHYLMEAERFSKRFVPFPGVNPNDKWSVRNINTLAVTFGIKGVKFSHQIPMGFSIDKLINHKLMKIIQEHNLVFMIHIGTGKEVGGQYVHTTLDYAIQVAKQYPDISFIFCHLGRLHWSLIEALQLKNVHMDTSALSMWKHWEEFLAKEHMHIFKHSSPTDVIEKLVALGYEDKILFGSDEPYAKYQKEIENINDANIPERAKRKIFYENIIKLLQ